MKTLILIGMLFIAGGCESVKNNTSSSNWRQETVYVSMANDVKTYHSRLNCCGMVFDADDLSTTRESAEKQGLVACKICFNKNEVRQSRLNLQVGLNK